MSSLDSNLVSFNRLLCCINLLLVVSNSLGVILQATVQVIDVILNILNTSCLSSRCFFILGLLVSSLSFVQLVVQFNLLSWVQQVVVQLSLLPYLVSIFNRLLSVLVCIVQCIVLSLSSFVLSLQNWQGIVTLLSFHHSQEVSILKWVRRELTVVVVNSCLQILNLLVCLFQVTL